LVGGLSGLCGFDERARSAIEQVDATARTLKTSSEEHRRASLARLTSVIAAKAPTDADREAQLEAALVAALLGRPDAVFSLLDEHARKAFPSYMRPVRSSAAASLRVLAWTVCQNPERHLNWLIGGLASDDAGEGATKARHELAAEVAKVMLESGGEPAQLAAAAIVRSLASARLADPLALDRSELTLGAPPPIQERLRRFAGAEEGIHALADACANTGGPNDARWVLAASLWSTGLRHVRAEPLIERCLIAGISHSDLAFAVTSASLLDFRKLSSEARSAVLRVWLRGLASVSPPLENTDPYWRRHQWHIHLLTKFGAHIERELRRASPSLAPPERALLAAGLEAPGVVRVVLAGILRDDLQLQARADAVLDEAVAGDNLWLAALALHRRADLQTCGSEQLRTLTVKLVLRGWWISCRYPQPPSRAAVEAFLDSTCSLESGDWSVCEELLAWLAEHPDALPLAITHLADNDVWERAVRLLAATMTSPPSVARVLAEVERKNQTLRQALLDPFGASLFSRSAEKASAASTRTLREGLNRLCVEALRDPEICIVYRAERFARGNNLPNTPTLVAARRRLLAEGKHAWRLELAWDAMLYCEDPEVLEARCQFFFDASAGWLAAGLAPLTSDGDPRCALEAALRIRRLVASTRELQHVALSILADLPTPVASVPDDKTLDHPAFHPLDSQSRLLAREDAKELEAVLTGGFHGVSAEAGLALAALVDIEDPSVIEHLRRWIESGRVRPRPVLRWLGEHRPQWWHHFDAFFIHELEALDVSPYASRRAATRTALLDALRICDVLGPVPLSQDAAAVLAERWADWLTRLSEGQMDAGFTLSDFAGINAEVPDACIHRWTGELGGDVAKRRLRGALALAASDRSTPAIVETLVDTYLAREGPWRLAAALLYTPHLRRHFTSDRVQRVTLCTDLAAAPKLVYQLWPPEERRDDRGIIAPILKLATVTAPVEEAVEAAELLWPLDPLEAAPALLRLSSKSSRAAQFLALQGELNPSVDARLWFALEHEPDGVWTHDVIAFLAPRAADNPRLSQILVKYIAIAQSDVTHALILLQQHDPQAVLPALIERLARSGSWPTKFVEKLEADEATDARGSAPAPTSAPPEPVVVEGDDLFAAVMRADRRDRSERREFSARTLAGKARELTHSEFVGPLAERLPEAMAQLVGVELCEIKRLWALAAHEMPDERQGLEIREIIDHRPADTPGQRLARLWWRKQLPLDALVDREVQEARSEGSMIAAPHEDPRHSAPAHEADQPDTTDTAAEPSKAHAHHLRKQSMERVDVGIVTMKEEEFEAVLDQLGKTIPLRPNTRRYEEITVDTGKGSIRVAVTRVVDQGNGPAQQAIHELIADLDPTFVLVVGIAGAVPTEDLTLGDVVVSSYIHDLTIQDTGTNGGHRFHAKGGPLHKDASALVGSLMAIKRRQKSWQDTIRQTRPSFDGKHTTDDYDWNAKIDEAFAWHADKARPQPIVTAQAIGTSDLLVKDPKYIQQWKTVLKGIGAVEMESAGALIACSHAEVPFVAIRGISDIIGWRRDEAWTLYACHSAAAFMMALLRSGELLPR